MPKNLKQLSESPVRLTGGHRLCPGCGEPIVVRQILMATEDPVIVANATGCLEVSTTIFPYTAWNVPWLHIAFENAAAAASGLEAMYVSLKNQGKIDPDANYKFVASPETAAPMTSASSRCPGPSSAATASCMFV